MLWYLLFGVVLLILVIVLIAVGISSAIDGERTVKKPEAAPRTTGTRTGIKRVPNHAKVRPTRGRPTFPITWFGVNDTLDVGGVLLKSPCVYASSGDNTGYDWATDPSEILLQAEVRKSRADVSALGYWPWYSRLTPTQRYEYLLWLHSGRVMLPPGEGFLFLFFYGIERRLLVDQLDRAWGLQEVVRLRRLDEPRAGTKVGNSFRKYSTAFLWYEIARTPERFDTKAFDLAVGLTEYWTPELIAAPLAWLAHHEQRVPAWLAQELASQSPIAQRSVVTKRVGDEFSQLFKTRYHAHHGTDGMSLRVSKRPRRLAYKPASGGLTEQFSDILNPLGIPSQFNALSDIWNSCVRDLRRLSRVAASTGNLADSVAAWDAMPEELRQNTDHPLTDEIASLVSDSTKLDSDGQDAGTLAHSAIVSAGSIALLADIEPRPTLTAAQSRKVASFLTDTGYGVVPDARVTPVKYGWNDEIMVLPGLDGAFDSAKYNAASCILRLGLTIAMADGHADDRELETLTDHIDAVFELSPAEDQRLRALRNLLLKSGSNIDSLTRKLAEAMPIEARQSVGRLLVAIAATTDGIERSERRALRAAFRALDLPPDLLDQVIEEIAPESHDAPVTVQVTKLDHAPRGERLPEQTAPKPDKAGFRLNREAISAILSETREVSAILASAMTTDGAFSTEGEELEHGPVLTPREGPPNPVAENRVIHGMSTLDIDTVQTLGRYTSFYNCITAQGQWEVATAEEGARGHGVMLQAAIEVINDWAFDALGDTLIEVVDDKLFVNLTLIPVQTQKEIERS